MSGGDALSWWAVLPGILGMAVLWGVPGYVVLRLLGVRGLVAWGAGFGVTSGLAGVLALAYDLIGVRWSLGSFLLGCLLVAGLAGGLGAALGTTRDPAGERVAGTRRLETSERRWLAATAALGTLLLGGAMMRGMYRPDQPLQAWDAVYHYNALWFIRDTGNASSLGGLSPLYAGTIEPYYPTVWHSIVAVAPGFAEVTEAGNASSIVLGTAAWIGGLLALSRVVWPARALPVVLTPVIAATFVTFPIVAVSMLGVWPFAVSVACLPGALALMIAALRGDQSWRLHLAHGLGLAGAAAGVVLAHGSGLFSIVLLAAPLLVVLLARQGRRFWRRGHRVAVVVAAVVLIAGVVGVASWLVQFPPVAAIIAYRRGGQDSYLPGIGSLLIDNPLIYVYPILSVNLAVTALVVVGVYVAVSRRHARWLVVALVASAFLTLLAAGPPDNPMRVLAGLWYTQPSRLNQLYVIPAVVLAAGGAAWVSRKIADRWTGSITTATVVVVAAIAVLTTGFRWPTQVEVMSSVYHRWPIAWGTILEPDEIEMIDRAEDSLPEDAVVLGEPVAGSPYLLARSDVEVVYPQLTLVEQSPERMLLAQDFDQWWRDTSVCEAVEALGVTHVYADDLTFDDGGKWESTTPGLRRISTRRPGFELVDSGGKASIWRFTGCSRD